VLDSRDFLLVSVMHLSISQLSELTGRERRTVSQKLADVPHIAGDRGAMLYKSVKALPLICPVRQPGWRRLSLDPSKVDRHQSGDDILWLLPFDQ